MNNIARNLTRCLSVLLLFSAAGSSACSDDDNDGVKDRAAKTTLTLKRYYNQNGSTTQPAWKADDKGVIFVSGAATAEMSYASPISVRSAQGFFLFTLNASGAPETVVSYYPSTADVTYASGYLSTQLPVRQTGTVTPLLVGRSTSRLSSYEGCSIELTQLWCTMYVNVKKGSYSIAKVTVKGNDGEKIAGNVSLNLDDMSVEADAATITVVPTTPVDCSSQSQTIAVMIAPVTLSKGYTVTLTDTDGNEFSVDSQLPVELRGGECVMTDNAVSNFATELVFCGSNMVYMIDADLADASGYKDAVTWSWDAHAAASIIGLAASRCDHLDDCKPVDNGSKLLITSSYNWCVLLDIATQQVLFYTTSCTDAHSAELLPGNRIAVACSTGNDSNANKVQIYDIAQPNKVLFMADLPSAHGVVWNSSTERLYAIGGQSLQIYKLKDWETSTPSIELERTVQTPRSGLHDMTLVNNNTLCIAGSRAYLYDIALNSFSEMTLFAASTALKSVNYNDETGELWYTDSTVPEGSQTWSTQTIRYSDNRNGSAATRTIKVPDLDMYKVRVKNW